MSPILVAFEAAGRFEATMYTAEQRWHLYYTFILVMQQ